jgi:arylsulfatase
MRITKRIWFGGLAFLAAMTAAGTPAMAQQTTGTPGSPGATTTIDGLAICRPRRSSAAR